MSYLRRRINVTFLLGKGSFGAEGTTENQIDLVGHRVSCTIVKANLPGLTTASLRLYGLTPAVMNKLSRLGMPLLFARENFVRVEAGDEKNGMAQVFVGQLQESWTDLDGMPDSCLHVSAHSGITAAMKPIAPVSYPGAAEVSVIMSSFANQLGYRFENSGVTGVLHNPYYPGTLLDQIAACARAIPCNVTLDNNTLAIWPKNGTRGTKIPLISPATGLVGYPAYSSSGIMFRSEFNPALQWGGSVKIESSLPPVNGVWVLNALAHELSSEMPDGPWFSNMQAYRFGDPSTLPS